MRFTTHEDVEAPIEFVFEQVSDFDAFERQGLRHGAEIMRLDTMTTPAAGMVWNAQAVLRGKRRRIEAELVDYQPPTMMKFLATSDGITAHLRRSGGPVAQAHADRYRSGHQTEKPVGAANAAIGTAGEIVPDQALQAAGRQVRAGDRGPVPPRERPDLSTAQSRRGSAG